MKPDDTEREENRDSAKKRTRKRCALICTAAGAAAVLVFASMIPALTQDKQGTAVVTQERPAAASTHPEASPADSAPTQSVQAAESTPSTPEPAEAEGPEWQTVDFSNSVFIGSSTTEGLYNYNMLEGADYIYGTGLTVDTVRTKPMPGGSVAAIDELAGKNYNQVFLAFGLNELGWPDDAVFCQMYADVIARIRQYLPTAAIYIESVLPVGIETSQRNRFGVNQDRINQFNAMLEQFAADQGVHFLNVSEELKGPDGYLPQEAAVDGIHPNREWAGKWVHLIRVHTEDILNAPTGATRPPQEESAPAEAAPDVPGPAGPVPEPAAETSPSAG